MNANSDKLISLQTKPENIRNICILAHVDHGKTTLADVLVASNGIISQKMAGKLRYLDSREDEQMRGITVKSSAISLHYQHDQTNYLVNLVDSPGHIDFASEVSTAVRLCDGAVVLVDVAEGVCSQTIAALRQAWVEHLRPVLVLNKIDRLVSELKLTPLEAYHHLSRILERVNSITGQLFASNILEQKSAAREAQRTSRPSGGDAGEEDASDGLDDADDSALYFAPDQGNVVFASAIDGWGFSVGDFVAMFSSKLKLNAATLLETLWGDFYLDGRTRLVKKGALSRGKKPLFVQIVLENIWHVYDVVLVKQDKDCLMKVCETLCISIPPRDLRHRDPQVQLQSLFTRWLPLSQAVLRMIVTKLPSPVQISEERVNFLICQRGQSVESLPPETRALRKDFLRCSSADDAPVIAFISKLFPMDKSAFPENRTRRLTREELVQRRALVLKKRSERMEDPEIVDSESRPGSVDSVCSSERDEQPQDEPDEVFLAFVRIFSGKISQGRKLYVLGPKHSPEKLLQELQSGRQLHVATSISDMCQGQGHHHMTECLVRSIYLLMGREVVEVKEAGAGCIVGIRGLDDHVIKSATLTDTVGCPALVAMHSDAPPILRVAVEPRNPGELGKLVHGLRLLGLSDPCVQVQVHSTGEHVITAAGEVHLQKCIDDLSTCYGKLEVTRSDCVVPLRETIVPAPMVDMVNEEISAAGGVSAGPRTSEPVDSTVTVCTPDGSNEISIRSYPLPVKVVELLEGSSQLIKLLTRSSWSSLRPEVRQSIEELRRKLESTFREATGDWEDACEQIWSFGPHKCGTNILRNRVAGYARGSVWCRGQPGHAFDASIEAGFQLATLSGPMCEEEMQGLCFAVERWERGELSDDAERSSARPGSTMAAVKDACRASFCRHPQRLVCPMYECRVHVATDVLGKFYVVLNKRHGRVIREELVEGTSTFIITAVLPVMASLGFAEEIRKRTSGHASPQLIFSHWEVLSTDPHWVPTTEQEYLHFGEKADSENFARESMNAVRRRKGLKVDEKIVEHGEKQRTLSRNV